MTETEKTNMEKTEPIEATGPADTDQTDQKEQTQKKDKFAPKEPVQLNPPKDDPISPEELAKCDGIE